MTRNAAQTPRFAPAQRIAERFVAARKSAAALDDYPGPIPADLDEAYAVQDAAIAMWKDKIAGWKVGRILAPLSEKFAEIRLAGPIFARQVLKSLDSSATVEFPVFVGGFAAIEAEYVFEIGRDAPERQMDWSHDEALEIAGRLFVGIETAGSPLPTINALGPTVVISDFGNNAGLILGAEVTHWRSRDLLALACESFVNGQSVGRGSAASLPGGPIEALRFTLEHCARRGHALTKGTLISTGAATGIHELMSGDIAQVDFAGIGTIRCRAAAQHKTV